MKTYIATSIARVKNQHPAFVNLRGWSKDRADQELKKCVLLCKCCHAAVHAGEITPGV